MLKVVLFVAFYGLCSSEFLSLPDKSYYVSKEKLNWTDAKLACENNGLELVNVLTENEGEKLETFIKEYKLVPEDVWNGYWLAGIRYPDGSFYWYNTATLVGLNMSRGWVFGEPSNAYKKEHCVELKNDLYLIGWNDYFCDEGRRYICQRINKEQPRAKQLENFDFLTKENPSPEQERQFSFTFLNQHAKEHLEETTLSEKENR